MYTREIQTPRAAPIEDGNPITGTWNRAFDRVDLLEIYKPYPYPVPRWARNYRIKEWHIFNAQDDNFLIEVYFYNYKLYKMLRVFVFDKQTGEKYFYKKTEPGQGWTLPESLKNSFIDEKKDSIFFRIHSRIEDGTVKLNLNIPHTHRRPSLNVQLTYSINDQLNPPIVVSLGIAERSSTCRRTMYSYKALASVNGEIDLGSRYINIEQDTCTGFFCDYKGFFPLFFTTAVCSAAGFIGKNRRFGFHIAENKTREPNKNNENALWIDGVLTPLPPVLITMPTGSEGMWVIQDVEGMIDLIFTPKEQIKTGIYLFGYYNGMLLTAEGEQIQIKNLLGIGEKFSLWV